MKNNTSLDIEKISEELEEIKEKINKTAELNMSEWSGILKKMKKGDVVFITAVNLVDLLLSNNNPINEKNPIIKKLKRLTLNIINNPDIKLKLEKNWFILDKNMISSMANLNRNSDETEVLKVKKLNNNKFVYFNQLSDYEIKKL